MLDETEFREMGRNVEALYEQINGTLVVTLKNDLGKVLLIFAQNKTFISRNTKPTQNDKRQLVLQINMKFYLLTFSNLAEATEFSEVLLNYVKPLQLNRTSSVIKSRLRHNTFTKDL